MINLIKKTIVLKKIKLNNHFLIKIVVSYILIYNFNSVFGQTDYLESVKLPPNISNLNEIIKSTNNESIGSPVISIPLYNIIQDGIEIPITLDYSITGNKVENESSWVGNSWNLNYGGVIIRKKIYRYDEINSFSYSVGPALDNNGNPYYPSCLVYRLKNNTGWFINSQNQLDLSNYYYLNNGDLTNYSGTIPPQANDYSPDIFDYYLPNRKVETFIIKNQNEIISSGNDIITYYTDLQGVINKFEVLDSKGIRYIFENAIYNEFDDLKFVLDKVHNIVSHSFTTPIYGVGLPPGICNESSNYGNSSSQIGSLEVLRRPTTDSWYISKIISPNNNEIVFNYTMLKHYSLLNTRSVISEHSYSYGSYNDFNRSNMIFPTSITWKNGSIYFITNPFIREDVKSSGNQYSQIKSLDKIIVKNNNFNIKTIKFNTTYNNAIGIENANENDRYLYKRLWLNSIYINDETDTPLKYQFNYNNVKLPQRLSFEQDYWGYYNGNGSDSNQNSFIPDMWFYPSDPRSYTRPTNFSIFRRNTFIGEEKRVSEEWAGNFSNRESNIEFAQAGILNEIISPSNGKIKYGYELNKFLIENQEIEGAGLRINKITYVDAFSQDEIVENYNYKDLNGLTSGRISNLPQNGYIEELYNTSPPKYTINSDISSGIVHYGRTEKNIIGQGKIVSYFLLPYEIETENSLWSESHNEFMYKKNYDISQFRLFNINSTYTINPLDYGNPPNSYNYDNLFGKLTKREIYNETGKIEQDEYIYEISSNSNKIYFLNTEKMNLNTIFIGKLNNIKKTNTKYYDDDKSIISTKEYTYNNKNFLKFEKTYNSNNDILENYYYYPFDSEMYSQPIVDHLISKNIIDTPLKIENFANGVKISEQLTEYANDINTGYNCLPKYFYQKKGDETSIPLEQKIIYDLYDTNGNLNQFTIKDGIPTSIIWGYSFTKPVAKIEGLTYNSINPSLIEAIQNATDSPTSNESIIISSLNNLRTQLSSSKITTYTYKPLIGISTITDINGDTKYYFYDNFNRLSCVKDKNENILNEYKYHYSLTFNIEVINHDETNRLITYKINSNQGGNYTYFWNSFTTGVNIEGSNTNDTFVVNYTNSNCDSVIAVKCNISLADGSIIEINNNQIYAHSVCLIIGGIDISFEPYSGTSDWLMILEANNIQNGSGNYTYKYYYEFNDDFVLFKETNSNPCYIISYNSLINQHPNFATTNKIKCELHDNTTNETTFFIKNL